MSAARVIRRSAEHLSHLVEGLLDMAQVEGGALTLSPDARAALTEAPWPGRSGAWCSPCRSCQRVH